MPYPWECCGYGGTTPPSDVAEAFFFHIAARRAKKIAAASNAIPASAPMTMPAIAPPDSFELESELEFDPAAASVDVGVDEGFTEAGEVEEPAAAEFELNVVLKIVALLVAVDELSVLDRLPPRTCASFTTPTLDSQQPLETPQHQRSLVAVPSQGVMRVLPAAYLVS